MSSPRSPRPTILADVLAVLLHEPGRPRLTWYGPDAERIELSGAVLVNWVTKTTNLLVEEMDAAPGTRVLIDLPPHWRGVVWALAAWRAGACVVLDEGADASAGVDVVVTSRPQAHPSAPDVVAVALPGLARSYPGALPAGALDAAAAVMTYGDVLGPTAGPVPTAPAVTGPGRTADEPVSHGDLLTAARAAVVGPADPEAAPGERARVLLTAADPLRSVLLRTLGVWALDGSVVLATPAVLSDDERVARLIQSERIAARLR